MSGFEILILDVALVATDLLVEQHTGHEPTAAGFFKGEMILILDPDSGSYSGHQH